jgi:hypothetical protein
MALIDELKEMRDAAVAMRDELWAAAQKTAHDSTAWHNRMDELEAAIRGIEALRGPSMPAEPDLLEAEQEVASEQLASDHALPPAVDDVVADEAPEPEFIELDEQTCEPVEERPALNEQMQDEREQPVEDGYAPVTSPEADFWARTLTEQPKPQSYSPFNIFRREKEDA